MTESLFPLHLFDPYFVIAASSLLGLCIVSFALLKGWQGWLELKRTELDRLEQLDSGQMKPRGGASIGAARIEISDLKERIRKLEAIASGVDL